MVQSETQTKTREQVTPETISGPEDLKGLSLDELTHFADEVRRFLLTEVSRTGGHIGANLGVVELTIALHRVFDSPQDRFVFDTGHQGYTHKIITGRSALFPTLNSYGGMNRFLTRTESDHDPVEASHAGTSVSVALGLALANRMRGEPHYSVAVIGDGALAEGMALEALNHAAVEKDTRLVCVLNDNGFAISPGFGALHEALQDAERAEDLFGALGYHYIGPVDGHDLEDLIGAFEEARGSEEVPIVHVKTTKGHGWPAAADHPYRQHFSFPFDVASGKPREALSQETYATVAAAEIEQAMAADADIVCITPSTLYATGLERVFERFPERTFDPGMEEQHAMTLTVGLALGGLKPVIAYQSTFMQRAFDQLIHDVCFMNRPTLLLSFRSGFAGYDNPTHHGVYDFSYLRCLPNLRVLYPKDAFEARRMVRDELAELNGPTLILMPYGPIEEHEPAAELEPRSTFAQAQLCKQGRDLVLVCVGHKFAAAQEACAELERGGLEPGLINLRVLQPLDCDHLVEALRPYERVVTLEEAVIEGGVGSAVSDLVHDHDLGCEVLRLGLPRGFIEPGSAEELASAYGLDARGVLEAIRERWADLA